MKCNSYVHHFNYTVSGVFLGEAEGGG